MQLPPNMHGTSHRPIIEVSGAVEGSMLEWGMQRMKCFWGFPCAAHVADMQV